MSGPFFGGRFFNGGFFAPAGDTHDGLDASDLNRKLDRQREEQDAQRKSHREHLRELLEAAFADPVPAPVAAEVREAAKPVVARLESGALRIDWEAIAEEHALQARLEAFREAFWAEQAALEDEDEAMLLLAPH